MIKKREKIMRICGIVYWVLTVLLILVVPVTLVVATYFAEGPTHLSIIDGAIAFAVMLYIRKIFKELHYGESPFNRRITRAAYVMAALTFIGAVLTLNFVGVFTAALVALFGLILDYGRILQQDADTTL